MRPRRGGSASQGNIGSATATPDLPCTVYRRMKARRNHVFSGFGLTVAPRGAGTMDDFKTTMPPHLLSTPGSLWHCLAKGRYRQQTAVTAVRSRLACAVHKRVQRSGAGDPAPSLGFVSPNP